MHLCKKKNNHKKIYNNQNLRAEIDNSLEKISFIGKHVSTFLPVLLNYVLDKMQTVTRKLEPNTKGDGIVYTPACHAGFVMDNH